MLPIIEFLFYKLWLLSNSSSILSHSLLWFSSLRDTKFFRISLTKNLEPGREITVDVETVYAHSLQPYPSHIAQSEKQFVKFTGNVYFYSPYKTQTLTTTVTCTTSTIDSYTKEKPVTHTDKTVSYGPYDNIDPYKEVWKYICILKF